MSDCNYKEVTEDQRSQAELKAQEDPLWARYLYRSLNGWRSENAKEEGVKYAL